MKTERLLAGVRIAIVSHSARSGGAEQVMLETIEILQHCGADCRVVLPESGSICEELRRLGVPFAIIRFPHWVTRAPRSPWLRAKTAVGSAVAALRLAWQLRRWRSDVVYTNTVTLCVGALAARLLRLPHLWHLHEFGYDDHGFRFIFGERLSLAAINMLSKRCICVSKALVERYRLFVDEPKITAVYPSLHRGQRNRGDDCAAERESFCSHSQRYRCAIVGTLIEGKGQEDAVRAFAELKDRVGDAELLIIGEGLPGYRSYLQSLIQSLGIDHRVVFTGHIANPTQLMRSCDLILICSRREGLGRVTIEAMLAGKPVIGSNTGATAEIIHDGVTGLLYEHGNCADLASKIRLLHDNPGFARQLAQNGRIWAETHFSAERNAAEMCQVIAPLVIHHHSSGGGAIEYPPVAVG
jgi:glycosyltransferase involved in cell wall biosynthesis